MAILQPTRWWVLISFWLDWGWPGLGLFPVVGASPSQMEKCVWLWQLMCAWWNNTSKHAYNGENGRCLAHRFGPCVHSCFHFQLSSSFSREDECPEMSSLPVIIASVHGLPRPECCCNWNLFQHRNKCREGSNQRVDGGAPNFSYPSTFSVSVIILFHTYIYNSIH